MATVETVRAREENMLGMISNPGVDRSLFPASARNSGRQPRKSEPFADGGEPQLEDLLSDPVTQAIMRCDNVSAGALRSLVIEARAVLKTRIDH